MAPQASRGYDRSRAQPLARPFAELAVSLFDSGSLDEVLDGVVKAAVEAIPSCDAASITLSDKGRSWTAAASDEQAAAADELQYKLGEGPCLDALHHPVVAARASDWHRWPRLAVAKADDLESGMSFGFLAPGGIVLGALNLYRYRSGDVDQNSEHAGLLLSAYSAIAVARARDSAAASRLEDDLRHAVVARDVIGQAKGLLMDRQGISAEEAFEVLRRLSQQLNVKLGDVARDLSERPGSTAERDAFDAPRVASALSTMLELAHELPPDRLPELGQYVAEDSGVRTTRVWLVDYAQRRLLPYGQPPEVEPFAVDGTVGGRAFVLGEIMEFVHDDGVILWAPLIDGVDRLGVVQFDLDRVDEHRRSTLTKIAELLASEIVTRGQYTDVITMARRTREMTLPAELQWNLLRPPSFATADVSVAAALEPSYEVGGDAYDYAYNDGKLHAAVFDAVGHDLESAIIANLLVATFRWCRRRGLELPEIAQIIDDVVHDQFLDGQYATALLLDLDVVTGSLRWIACGHPAPMLIRDGRVVGELSTTPTPPLGYFNVLEEPVVATGQTVLQPGDRVLIYTDGLIEARTLGGDDFGLDRLQEFMHRAFAGGLSAAETVRRLSHAVIDHHGSNLRDDASLVLVHWHPGLSESK